MNHALDMNKDFWNHGTPVHITKLEVLPPRVKAMDQPVGKFVTAGQLFTAVAVMNTHQGGRVEVSVTGYLRATLEISNPRGWQPSDCYAPRKHNGDIPAIRLLGYPRNLCSESGKPITPLELSQLIAQQLNDDNGWREHICTHVPPITSELIREELGLVVTPVEPTEVAASPGASENGSSPASNDQMETASSAPLDDNEDEFHFDERDLEEIATELDQNNTTESMANTITEPTDGDLTLADLDEDDEDLASLIDEWEDEDLQLESRTSDSGKSEDFAVSGEALDANAQVEKPKRRGFLQAITSIGRKAVSEQANEEFQTEPVETATAVEEHETGRDQERRLADDRVTEAKEPQAVNPEQSRMQAVINATDTVAGEQPKATPAPATGNAESRGHDESGDEKKKRAVREIELFHSEGFDVAFFGLEHGEAELADKSRGQRAKLYTTRGGRIVLHIDEHLVEDFANTGDEVKQVFDRMGYGKDAKKAYRSAEINCVRWLD